ncbi:hypothetical protein [Catenuloplanes indicus]|uniref:Uncharacterized protein (DUF697 family) n=1 Tax=Catenuloplanes indicus TaxID=137267 RepID=A0AAE3W4R4_9ACTN|nr:hypothetical protein [Catenuloplanes indicus]MDQ0369260.1 uncharacterized protein (DUF697 family) [Catenuloplanes indicus]
MTDASNEQRTTAEDVVPATEPGVPAAGTGDPERLSQAIAGLAEEELPTPVRRRLLGRLVQSVRTSGAGRMIRPKVAIQWMVDTVHQIAPYVPIRDLETLRRHHPGLTDEELAERLVRNASRATAGIGAAGGGVAAIEWAVPPTLLSTPVLLATETVAVVSVELKLIGELHEIYGQPVTGSATERAVAMLQSWSSQRGVNPLLPGAGVGAVLGTAARRELRDMLLKRFGRNLTTLGPLLTGAAVASYLNRRATRGLGDRLREDLRTSRAKLGGHAPRSIGKS